MTAPPSCVLCLQASAHQERSHAQQQVLALEQQCRERTQALETQLAALEKARETERTAAQQGMVRAREPWAGGAACGLTSRTTA